MFVRKIRNRSGSISVQLVHKNRATRRNKVIKHFGSSSDASEVERLCATARQWADEHSKGFDLFEDNGVEHIRNAADYDAVFICFTAYTIMLELERVLKASKSNISLDRARFLAERVYAINYVNPYNNQHKSVLLRTENDSETHELLKLLGKI